MTPTTQLELLTRRQTATVLGVSVPTLTRWGREGRGPRPLRLTPGSRGRVMYRAADIQAFVETLAAAPTKPFAAPAAHSR
jgi:predicted DNA-binding transcriptional regulator AlpA